MSPASSSKRPWLWPLAVVTLLVLAFLPAQWANVYGAHLRSVVHTLLVPLSSPLTALCKWVGYRRDQPALDELDVEQLREQLLAKDGLIVAMERRIRDLRQENEELQRLKKLTADAVIPLRASVIAAASDPTSGLIQIDRGSRDGVREGMAVVQGTNLVGRVVQVGLTSSAVRPITAAENLLDVVFTPPVLPAEGLEGARRHPVQVQSVSRDELAADDVARSVPVEVEDLVRLRDRNWPRTVQGMIVGQVASVADHPEDPLRKRVRVRPLVSVYHLSTVTVLKPRSKSQEARQP